MTGLVIHVAGLPAAQGSKRHVGRGIMVESSKAVKPWRQAVKHAALDARPPGDAGGFVFLGPVEVHVTFYLPRPKGHHRTGRNALLLRDTAPAYPAGRPDVDKLVRSTLDGIGEAGIWRDDAQVVVVRAVKRYINAAHLAGAEVGVRSLPATVAEDEGGL